MGLKIPKILTDFQLYLDGYGLAGEIKSWSPPKINMTSYEHQDGSMSGPVDIGLGAHEKLETTLVMSSYSEEVFNIIGVHKRGKPMLIARGALDRDGVIEPAVAIMRPFVKGLEMHDWAKGTDTELTFPMTLWYYKFMIGPKNIVEIDILDNIFKIGERNIRADIKAAIFS